VSEPGPDDRTSGSGIGLPPFVANAAAEAAAELPKRAADVVAGIADTIHDRAIRPITLIARAAVYGILIAALLVVVLLCVCIGLLRFLDVYAFGHRVWLSYLVIGGVFSAVGLYFMLRASRGARTT
jgi:hypothetical protein